MGPASRLALLFVIAGSGGCHALAPHVATTLEADAAADARVDSPVPPDVVSTDSADRSPATADHGDLDGARADHGVMDGAAADVGCPDPAGACQDGADWIETGGTCGSTACVKACGQRELECQSTPWSGTWCKCYLCSQQILQPHLPASGPADDALAGALEQGYCIP